MVSLFTDLTAAEPLTSPLFAGAPESFVRAMLSGCETRELSRGECLLAAGDDNDVMYLVLHGTLRVRLPETARPIVPVGPGECVGELSLLDERRVSADVFAEDDATVMAIDRDQLWRLMEHVPVVARNMLRLLAGRVRNDNRMLQDADRMQSLYENAATVDALTGLRNRRWLNDAFARQLLRSLNAGQPVSVLMLDADRFKRINDVYGHLVGDEVLIHVGQTIASGLRPLDLLARYGGEEFSALLPGVSNHEAFAAAERLRHAVESHPPHTTAGVLTDMTVSIGVATASADAPMTLLALLERADAALLEAKQAGRNCVRSIHLGPFHR